MDDKESHKQDFEARSKDADVTAIKYLISGGNILESSRIGILFTVLCMHERAIAYNDF